IDGAPATSGVASTFTPKVGQDITVVVTNGGASQTYTVRYIPSDFPKITTTTTPQAGSEYVLLSTVSLNPTVETYAIMMARAGNAVYYRTFPQQEVQDFQQYKLASGATVYACTVGEFNPAGWTLGVDHVMDDKFNDVTDIQILPNAQHQTLPAEAHDFVMLDTNHYVAETYVQRTVDLSKVNPAWSSAAPVMNAIVQEVNNGSVVGEWDSGNEMSLYTDSVDGNAFGPTTVSDYMHLNSIAVDPADGNWILSLRHTNSIIKVDHTTAKILWTLGGKEDMFGLTDDQAFSHQHHVRVQADGSITVFDNGNDAHQSRAISFVLDETNHVVTSFQVLAERPLADPQTGFMGSVSLLPQGRIFVGWGGWFTTQTAPGAVEYLNGQVAWSFEFAGPLFSYRALPVTLP
ncbi:MAG TPA: arylsulfotransferase family protein, partial [Polyangiaceae bacterium]